MYSVVLPILLFVVAATLMAVGMLVAGVLVGPRRTSPVKQMPYESGMDPVHDTRRRFDVRFHLVAIAFLVFDVELLFLYPWAVAHKQRESAQVGVDALIGQAMASGVDTDRLLVFGGVMAFLALVVVGFIYEWRRGVLQWR